MDTSETSPSTSTGEISTEPLPVSTQSLVTTSSSESVSILNQELDLPAKKFAALKPVPFHAPRFEPGSEEAKEFLDKYGFVVYRSAANETEIATCYQLLWDWLEDLGTGLKRNDPKTWKSRRNWPAGKKGIVWSDSAGQSPHSWYARSLKSIHTIFSSLYFQTDLAVSFDGFNIFRPLDVVDQLPKSWYHIDQNPNLMPDSHCYQGFLNLQHCGDYDSGLVVVPRSHKYFIQAKDFIPKGYGHFVSNLPKLLFVNTPIKVCAKAGDFVVWDSRTVHMNQPPTYPRSQIPPKFDSFVKDISPLARFVIYICMEPRYLLDKSTRKQRKDAFKKGYTTSHWARFCKVNGMAYQNNRYKSPKLSKHGRSLI